MQDQDNFALRGLCGDAALYGHAPLHDALMDFCVRWSDGLDVLTDDAGQIGDALTRVSNAYRAVNGQPVKLDGKPGSNAETHIPRNPDDSYPVPNGW